MAENFNPFTKPSIAHIFGYCIPSNEAEWSLAVRQPVLKKQGPCGSMIQLDDKIVAENYSPLPIPV